MSLLPLKREKEITFQPVLQDVQDSEDLFRGCLLWCWVGMLKKGHVAPL